MDYKEAVIELESMTSKKRFKHTMGVVDASKKLAKLYGEDPKKAKIAALLHDCAKCFDAKQIEEHIDRYGIMLDNIEREEYELVHGKIGREIAKDRFKIEDEDILNSIEYHTTGRVGMSVLEKIIYLSDFIEPTREYEGVEELRELALEDLNKAVLQAFDNTIRYVISIRKMIHPRTIEARNDILKSGV